MVLATGYGRMMGSNRQIIWDIVEKSSHHMSIVHGFSHGLQTPNEGINQSYLKKMGRCGRQNLLRLYLKIWE
jgi:hypothetical protein